MTSTESLTFDAVDYLHAFADDATGCTITASKTIHSIADDYERLLAEVDRLRNRLNAAQLVADLRLRDAGAES